MSDQNISKWGAWRSAKYGHHINMLRFLCEGGDVNTVCPGTLWTVKPIYNREIDDTEDCTLLAIAAMYLHYPVVMELVRHGADLNIKSGVSRLTALEYAIRAYETIPPFEDCQDSSVNDMLMALMTPENLDKDSCYEGETVRDVLLLEDPDDTAEIMRAFAFTQHGARTKSAKRR